MATKAQKAATQSESPQQQTLPMQYDVRIHSLRLDGNCRAHASVNINGCFAIRGVKVMESSKGLFVSKAVLDQKQRILLEHINEHPEIMVTWFQPDEKKDGGQYITTTGRLKRFDESACMLLLKDGSNIPISHIIGLESAYFEGRF